MAKKVAPDATKVPAAKPAAGAEDLNILMPDNELTIGGEKIVVREYRFFEGLRLQADEKPFFDDLYVLLAEASRPPSFDDVLDLIGRHDFSVALMVGLATDRPIEWVQALGESDGDALLLTWWQVNSGFFVRRVMRRALQDRMAGSRSDGLASTTG